MSKLAQVFEWLKVAMEIARFLEVAQTLLKAVKGDVSDGDLIDVAVGALNANGWGQPSA